MSFNAKDRLLQQQQLPGGAARSERAGPRATFGRTSALMRHFASPGSPSAVWKCSSQLRRRKLHVFNLRLLRLQLLRRDGRRRSPRRLAFSLQPIRGARAGPSGTSLVRVSAAIFVLSSWMSAASRPAGDRYLFVKSQPHLRDAIGWRLLAHCPKVDTHEGPQPNPR